MNLFEELPLEEHQLALELNELPFPIMHKHCLVLGEKSKELSDILVRVYQCRVDVHFESHQTYDIIFTRHMTAELSALQSSARVVRLA